MTAVFSLHETEKNCKSEVEKRREEDERDVAMLRRVIILILLV